MPELQNHELLQSSTILPASQEVKYGVRWGFVVQNVVCVAAFTAVMAGFGALAGSDFENRDVVAEQNLQTDVNIAQSNISNIQDMLLEVEDEAQDLDITYGQACVTALRQYIDDPQLAVTATDSIVVDVVTDPSAPCGTTPVQVRKKYLGITDVLSRHTSLKDYPMAERMQEIDRMKNELEYKNNTSETHMGAWILGLFGLFVGCLGAKVAYDGSDGGRL